MLTIFIVHPLLQDKNIGRTRTNITILLRITTDRCFLPTGCKAAYKKYHPKVEHFTQCEDRGFFVGGPRPSMGGVANSQRFWKSLYSETPYEKPPYLVATPFLHPKFSQMFYIYLVFMFILRSTQNPVNNY